MSVARLCNERCKTEPELEGTQRIRIDRRNDRLRARAIAKEQREKEFGRRSHKLSGSSLVFRSVVTQGKVARLYLTMSAMRIQGQEEEKEKRPAKVWRKAGDEGSDALSQGET